MEVVEKLPGYTLLACRLETGRTHQIRIHLAELGNPVCGEKVYNRKPGGTPEPDRSGAPRLALHAAELGFMHPIAGKELHWSMPLPRDLQVFLDRLRQSYPPEAANRDVSERKSVSKPSAATQPHLTTMRRPKKRPSNGD